MYLINDANVRIYDTSIAACEFEEGQPHRIINASTQALEVSFIAVGWSGLSYPSVGSSRNKNTEGNFRAFWSNKRFLKLKEGAKADLFPMKLTASNIFWGELI
jgi:hypothetical protein